MKKLTAIIAIATACMIGSQAKADTFTISFGLGYLRNNGGALAPNGSVVVVVADTSGLGAAGLAALPAATTLTAGSLIGGGSGDLVLGLGMYSLSGSYFDQNVTSQNLASPLVTGQNIYVLWFPTLTTSAPSVGFGTQYGVFRNSGSPASNLEGGATWAVPAGGAGISMYADDGANGGPFLTTDFTANQISQVPEPSTIVLVGFGLLGAIGLARRRS